MMARDASAPIDFAFTEGNGQYATFCMRVTVGDGGLMENVFLRGESYPELASAFYAPLIESTRACLSLAQDAKVRVGVALTSFNSASTKALLSSK